MPVVVIDEISSVFLMDERLWLRFLYTYVHCNSDAEVWHALEQFAAKAGLPWPGPDPELDKLVPGDHPFGTAPIESWPVWLKNRGIENGLE